MTTKPSRPWSDERGVALPTAMIALVILMALTFAFTSLATTEPSIGRNHSMSEQARGYGESGIELVIYALNAGASDTTWGIPDPASMPAAYTGYSHFFAVSPNGGFDVKTIYDPLVPNEVTVWVRGWAPDATGQLHAVKKVEATVTKPVWATRNPTCALCVAGVVDISGSVTIDARSGFCTGSTPLGGSLSTGATTRSGAADVYGPGDGTPNQPADMPQNQPASNMNTMTWDDLKLLRSMAQAAGPGHYFSGPTTFDDNHPLPAGGGIVFVDTTTGTDLTTTPSMTPSTEMGSVTINGNITWSGWIIAIGDVTVTGTVSLTGTVYARNDFVFNGNGTVTGNVTAENKLGTQRSSVDASLSGHSTINYDCAAAKSGGGTVSTTTSWTLDPGSYREVEGS